MIMQESKSDFQKKKISIFTTMCVQQHTQTYLCAGKRQKLSHEQTL